MADRLAGGGSGTLRTWPVSKRTFYNTMSALRRSASERGRALNAQKMVIGKDYDVISMKARAVAARGKKLSPKEAKNIERLAKNITDFTKAEEAILDRIAKRMGKERGELDIDVNGFPLDATSEELASLMAQRRLAVELKMAADMADLKAKDRSGYYWNLHAGPRHQRPRCSWPLLTCLPQGRQGRRPPVWRQLHRKQPQGVRGYVRCGQGV